MTIEKYQELTGITVASEDTAKVNVQLNRTRLALEAMLGYSLKKSKAYENQYEEKGIAKVECPFRGLISDITDLELDPPDTVIGSYRIFNFNNSDNYFKVDPYTRLHKVKLVFLQSGLGNEPNGITHKTFEAGRVRIHKEKGIQKYIERCPECWCICECYDNCVQLAVDADWLNEDCLPEELSYLWAEMVEFYSNDKRDVVAETLGTHSYKLDKRSSPETLDTNIAIIKKYAGPHGSLNRTIVV